MFRSGLKTALLAASALIVSAGSMATAQRGNGFPGGTITLYDGKNYTGEAVTIDGPVERLVDLRFNDRASSAEISGFWELCNGTSFRDTCEIVNFSMSDLGAVRLNDNISSLRPVSPRDAAREKAINGRVRGPGIVLFSGLGFTGEALPVDRAIIKLSGLDFNDKALSVRVNHGSWLLCEDANSSGRCEVISADVRDLGQFGLNRRVSSIEPYTGQAYGADPGYGSGPVYGGGPGYGQGGGYGRDRSPGYGPVQPYDQALEGVDTVFFTNVRNEAGQPIRAYGFSDDRFCQALGLRDAEYSANRSGFLTDVLCEK